MALVTELMALYGEKIARFEGLLAILEREGEVLQTGDVAPLWPLAEEKQKAAAAIMEIRTRIVACMERSGRSLGGDGRSFYPEMLTSRLSQGERAALEASLLRIEVLKQQVKAAGDANLRYLRLCLDVVGEMMSAFMRPAQAGGYDRSRRMAGAGNTYVSRRV